MSADAETSDILAAAAAISTGGRVEWDRLEQRTTCSDDADIVRELRVIDQIARFHRDEEERESVVSPPLSWGHLTIIESVGAGVFGNVYRATEQTLQREVALKLLSSPDPDGGFDLSRVLKEARLLTRVVHNNVVTVYGADCIENRGGIWMEFIEGHTLEALLLTHGPFSAHEAALIGLDLCRALAAVHRAKLMHGDVKAHNVMREAGGRTVLMDFGTGKDLGSESSAARQGQSDIAGTPLYLSPEVFEGQPRTKSADIYSLGVLLYHLVTEAYPVEGTTAAAVRQAHARGERTYLRDARPDLPDAFVQVVERAVAADPERRWKSAGAFEAELARFLGTPTEPDTSKEEAHERSHAWPWVVAATGVAALFISVTGYWLAGRDGSTTAPHSVTPSSEPQPPATTVAGAYTIDAALYRERGGSKDRLQPGASVQPGDKLSLDIRVSTPAHVYVVNEDDRGESFLLFPLSGQKVTNPLPAGLPTRLPGDELSWQVTSAGGQEHFLIFASPEPVPALERMLDGLPRAKPNAPVARAPLSRDTLGLLRGVGGLTLESPRKDTGPRLIDQFTTELAQTAETTKGIWVRQITLANPSR